MTNTQIIILVITIMLVIVNLAFTIFTYCIQKKILDRAVANIFDYNVKIHDLETDLGLLKDEVQQGKKK